MYVHGDCANNSISAGLKVTHRKQGKRRNKFYSILILLLASAAVLGATLTSGEAVSSAATGSEAARALSQFQSTSLAATSIREATGANAASIQTTVDQFRTDLGTLRPNTKSSFPDGRREINWDGVPDGSSAPNNLPADFFNNNSPRGAVFSTPGTGFQVSMDDDNPTDADPDQVRFDNLNSTYSSQFNVFSAQRLFTAISSNVTDITFFVPGTNVPATVTGFGAVFTDVDNGGSTSIQFFDPDGNLLLIRNVLATPGSQSLSFLGVSFTNGQRVSRVRITGGNSALGPNDNPGAGVDVVAMDDFIYAEPQPAACTPQTITGDIGQGSANYPSTSGVQTGRIVQNGVDSSCAAPKTCPGIASAGSSFTFDGYQFANNSNATACVTFTFPTACGVNNAVHPVAYLGSFDPANPCTNYLGDIGHSISAGESGAFSVNVPANSIVVLVVHEIGTQPGCQGYSFSVSGLPPCYQAQLPCPPQTITGNIGQGSANYPSTSGVQTGRIAQNAVDSSCASPKTCPGVVNGNTFAFDAYQFANNSNATACVTFTFPTACGVNNAVHPVAYLGSFDPANPCTNYLGDIGHSINAGASGAFSVNVPANSIVVLVVHEIGTQPGCQGYSFSVSGLPPCPPTGGCTLTCPANITQSNTPGQCGAVVAYPPPTTSGQCGAISCIPPSGSFFPIGTTTVTCTEGNGASCSFTVTIVDTQPPTITCPANIIAVTNQTSCTTGAATTIANFANPVASDNCPGVTVICNPPSGSQVPVGTTTVTCTATDAAGNTATCNFAITAFDVCLQDDSNPGTVLLFNSATGDYRFCCTGSVFTGRGTVVVRGCTITLQHNATDRRVSASVDKNLFKGNATLQSPPGSTRCTISDRDIRNNACACS